MRSPMRAVYEAIRLPEKSSLRSWQGIGRSLGRLWHFHPEIEILSIERSRGLRFVGDSVAPFREGDLVIIGPDLPHVWLNDNPNAPPGHAIATGVQFREDFLGESLWQAPELAPIAALLRRSRQGVRFTGPNARKAAQAMREMPRVKGVRHLLLLFTVLDLLASSRNQQTLSSSEYVPNVNRADAARINAACGYVRDHLTNEIWRDEAARRAGLASAAFSRFFRQKMGCTFSSYVNQLRIARAIHLMVEEEKSVSEACFASGFNNLSNFNAHFRRIKGMSPRAYLDQLQRRSATG